MSTRLTPLKCSSKREDGREPRWLRTGKPARSGWQDCHLVARAKVLAGTGFAVCPGNCNKEWKGDRRGKEGTGNRVQRAEELEIVEEERGRTREGETDSTVVLGAFGAPPDSARGLLIETRSSRDTGKQLKQEEIRQGKSKMQQFYSILKKKTTTTVDCFNSIISRERSL